MLKRFTGILLCIVLFLGLTVTAFAAEESYNVYVDDELIAESCAVYNQAVYVPLVAVAEALNPEVSAVWEENRAQVTAESFILTAKPGDYYLIANGRYLFAPNQIKLNGDGVVLVPLSALARAMGTEVVFEETSAKLQSGGTPIASGDEFYDEVTVDLLARVIANESENQPLFGQIGVGNVLLNRVASPIFPGTLSEVINQPGQFPGVLKAEPTAGCIVAAKLCLDGASTVGSAFWFSGTGRSCWASRNKQLVTTIGGHAFYG